MFCYYIFFVTSCNLLVNCLLSLLFSEKTVVCQFEFFLIKTFSPLFVRKIMSRR